MPDHPLPSVPALPPAHHVVGPDGRRRGFRNVHAPVGTSDRVGNVSPGFLLDLQRAQRTRLYAPRVEVDHALLRTPPRALRLTWLGHTAVLAQFAGINVLLDPMLGPRASPFSMLGPKRLAPPAIAPVGFPGVDVVVFSHDHYDHLDAWTTRILIREYDPLFLVPLGMDVLLRAWGSTRVVALDWGQAHTVQGVAFTALPARHFSGRGLHDRNRTLWASWWMASEAASCYFAGDTGFGTHFAEIAAAFGAPDVALLPIGAYEPRGVMAPVHMDPLEAVEAMKVLRPRLTLPTHWGTFVLTTEAVDEPPRAFVAAARLAGLADAAHVWKVGESVEAP